MRQARVGAAALRMGTAAVVARVGRGGGGWCAVFRGGVGSKEAAAGVRDEVRCRVDLEIKLTLQRTSGCVVEVSHLQSTVGPQSVHSALLLLRVSLSKQQQSAAHQAGRKHVTGLPVAVVYDG
jgi:hypothetical protein